MEHDPSDLPEMQKDMEKQVNWLSKALADGAINRDTYRQYLRLPMLENTEMETFTVAQDVIPLSEAINSDFNLDDQAAV